MKWFALSAAAINILGVALDLKLKKPGIFLLEDIAFVVALALMFARYKAFP